MARAAPCPAEVVPRIVPDDGKLLIEAEAHLEGGDVEVTMLRSRPVAGSDSVPRSLINQAYRTQQRGLLEDAEAMGTSGPAST